MDERTEEQTEGVRLPEEILVVLERADIAFDRGCWNG